MARGIPRGQPAILKFVRVGPRVMHAIGQGACPPAIACRILDTVLLTHCREESHHAERDEYGVFHGFSSTGPEKRPGKVFDGGMGG